MPIRHKLHVKIGDTVQLISGHDKGKVSEIAEIDYIRQMVLCKDINLKTKHKKPRAKGESGQIVQVISKSLAHFIHQLSCMASGIERQPSYFESLVSPGKIQKW